MQSVLKIKRLDPRIFAFVVLVIFTQSLRAELGASQLQIEHPVRAVDRYSHQYDELFRYYSKRYFGPFIDWRWFKAQAIAESRFDSRALSRAGAAGLMQMLPSTFQKVRSGSPYPGDIFDPRDNIAAAMVYNRKLFRKWNRIFNGPERLLLMFASYNAGFYRIHSIYGSVLQTGNWDELRRALPNETRRYLKRIQELMRPVEYSGDAVAARDAILRLAPPEFALSGRTDLPH